MINKTTFTSKRTLIALSLTALLSACGDNDNDFSNIQQPAPTPPTSPAPAPEPIPAFSPDGTLSADVTWTKYGVPHVKADTLESMAYGVGYAFARDNLCVLADQILKYNSERAKYFGPDAVPGSGDSEHLINDFGFITLGIRELAEENLPRLSANSRAMFQGYTAGYNRYLNETPVDEQDQSCAGQPWVTEIDSVDLLTYSLGVALLPGAANFLGPMFIAAPEGESYLPTPTASSTESTASIKIAPTVKVPDRNPQEMGSNGWGLGSDKTTNGKGMVLGNPHFPHTGNLRFWNFHAQVPGHLNVTGGSLMGLPGAVNIGFNENVAWTHTFSTAEHFVVYQLTLDENDEAGLTHVVDGNRRTIYEKPMQIDVAVGGGQTITLEKTAYYTNYGPMIEVPGNFDWSDTNAFAIKDANLPNFDIVDHWLAMNMATSMDEFKQAFKDYDGVIFNNTMAASSDGQVFYIDDSTVPNLTETAIEQLTTNPLLIQTKAAAGFTVLPGNISQFDFEGPVPYEEAPKYEGTDSVQNSNDSYWLTNLNSPIVVSNPLFGNVDNQQSLRSRMGQQFIENEAGSDGTFTPQEVEGLLFNNRSYLAENILPSLLEACANQGDTPVNVDGTAVDISVSCAALEDWDGTMNLTSTGAHVFREFAFQFNQAPQWETPFSLEMPVTTPSGLMQNDVTLQQLARATQVIEEAGIAFDAPLGDVQFVERSLPDGTASGVKLPWAGAHNIEGGFNVFDVSSNRNGTLLPRHSYETINNNTAMSAQAEGYHINYGTSWAMVINFTDEGPKGRGILTYSQSRKYGSEHFLDQTRLYSTQPTLRDIYFTEEEIEANKIEHVTLSSD
ncbi:acylase [Alteromonas mediterranea]|uniref:acylase n=1 Tax=Alteromonas mediterranea TaxID=314275 RepID=UPI0003557CF0|nr:acylase [Alteromonas mediterranea]AGP85644.1 penicillin acylase-like protein [Alteromonas mediterranea U4]AGP89782.1 penicillin acylase-like protein [Alteromonas mediterranea U7]AGP93650.1 penicillin acylase-like protein [Alteromonas mediterranea U8]MBR9895801.1 acylase [Gammaproteobacteria bacterium]